MYWSANQCRRRPFGGLPRLICLLGLTRALSEPSLARADWSSDERYVHRLQQQVTELRKAVALFERHRRALELVEAEASTVQLGLADPHAEPVEIIKRVLRTSYPQVSVAIERLAASKANQIGTWTWRCSLAGAVEELRWATQLLRQKGLFIVPSGEEPVTLVLKADQRRGSLLFVGHHIRLRDPALPPQPKAIEEGPDISATRTDPLALQIRQLKSVVSALRGQVADIQGFEARVNAIRQYIVELRQLTRAARDPFLALTPLLDLELMRFRSLIHQGDQVLVDGSVISSAVGDAALRWLKRRSTAHLRYQLTGMELYQGPPPTKPLALATPLHEKGPRCSLLATRARAIDLALAAAPRGGAMVSGTSRTALSGRLLNVPCQAALAATASSLGFSLIKSDASVLLVPSSRAVGSAALLRERFRGARGPLLELQSTGQPFKRVLAWLSRRLPDAIEVPRQYLGDEQSLVLGGRAAATTWLRLAGAARGLQLSKARRTLRLKPAASSSRSPAPLERVTRPTRPPPSATTTTSVPLNQLQMRLIVAGTSDRTTMAIISDAGGQPYLVRRGSLLGRNRSKVLRIDSRGLTVRWSANGITRQVLIPPGEPQASARTNAKK